MKRAVYDQKEKCMAWAEEVIGHTFGPNAHCVGLVDGDALRAVTVWDDFSPWNCTMSIASDGSRRWMTRDFLFRSFAYPFIQLGLRRATVVIAADNDASIRLALHIGFTVECARVPELFGDKDGIVMGMLRKDCRWINLPREQQAAA